DAFLLDSDAASASACDLDRVAAVATFDRNAISSFVERCSLTASESSLQLASAPPSATERRSARTTGSFAPSPFSASVQRRVSVGSGGWTISMLSLSSAKIETDWLVDMRSIRCCVGPASIHSTHPNATIPIPQKTTHQTPPP